MRFATVVFVRTCIAAPIAFVLLMALVWAVDKVWGVDSVLEPPGIKRAKGKWL